jgi:hypothetical protein
MLFRALPYATLKGAQEPAHVRLLSESTREISQFVSQDQEKFARQVRICGLPAQNTPMMIFGDSLEPFLGIRKRSLDRYFDRVGWVIQQPADLGDDRRMSSFGAKLSIEALRLQTTIQYRTQPTGTSGQTDALRSQPTPNTRPE